jgi:hypothetical protein
MWCIKKNLTPESQEYELPLLKLFQRKQRAKSLAEFPVTDSVWRDHASPLSYPSYFTMCLIGNKIGGEEGRE